MNTAQLGTRHMRAAHTVGAGRWLLRLILVRRAYGDSGAWCTAVDV